MTKKQKLLSLTLPLGVVLLDQITKMLIVAKIPVWTVGKSFFGDFLRIVHVRNLGIAFSLGDNFPEAVRSAIFKILPLIALVVILIYYFKSEEFSVFQGWNLAGIIGGGFGNLIDRFFRPEGVVDFIDVKFYGLFGLERWPTFNVADATVVVCGILFALSLLKKK